MVYYLSIHSLSILFLIFQDKWYQQNFHVKYRSSMHSSFIKFHITKYFCEVNVQLNMSDKDLYPYPNVECLTQMLYILHIIYEGPHNTGRECLLLTVFHMSTVCIFSIYMWLCKQQNCAYTSNIG